MLERKLNICITRWSCAHFKAEFHGEKQQFVIRVFLFKLEQFYKTLCRVQTLDQQFDETNIEADSKAVNRRCSHVLEQFRIELAQISAFLNGQEKSSHYNKIFKNI